MKSSIVDIDHISATDLAEMLAPNSNLAMCYLESRKELRSAREALEDIKVRAYASRNDASLNGTYAFDLIYDAARAALKE